MKSPFAKRTVGILGGSFNPAHDGHLYISRQALRRIGLDEIWWLVSPQNPLKSTLEMAPFDQRFSSAKAISRKIPFIRVSNFETRLKTRYTADTLRKLIKEYQHYRFVWIMGADNLAQIHRWHEWKIIFSLVSVAVYDRSPYTYRALHGKAAASFAKYRKIPENLLSATLPAWCFMHGKRHPLSATSIRKKLGKNG